MVESPVTRWRSSTGIAADSSELKDSIPTKLLLPDNVGRAAVGECGGGESVETREPDCAAR